ncbi:MAG TPA: NrtA/SsuA/CpmA family ABC transporter substrate-binding protein [Candidatus Binatia bacterium]|jgi:NitT/TauT family transport system substrate-binding protein|nr:NrtA/SsuA/CpmA family ABC transporter substrate-binding protein [Candidatus Binatia bacterium]
MLSRCKTIIVVLGLLGVSSLGHAQTVRISYGGTSGYNVPIWVAYEAGLFKKYGLTGELILISGDAASIQALLANDLQFTNAAGTTPIQATLQGADPVIIASSYNLMPYSFVVHPDVHSAADLKGKRMAVSRLGGITEFAARLTFERLGLGQKDMTLIQAGPDGQRIAALQSGAVAATVLAPPGLYAATNLGLKVMADLGDLGVKYPSAVMVARRSYVAQNRPTVKRFLMTFIEGLHVYAQKKDFTLGVMQKYARLRDREAMAKSHDYFLKNTTLVPLTDPVAIRNALADKADGRKLEEFFDNSIVQELIDEGFVEKVSKGR